MIIWIDADACPKVIKEVIYKAAIRLQVPVKLVANSSMYIPPNKLFSLITVKQGLDVADFYIVEHAAKNDLVITADIPLASDIVAKDIVALNPRGEVYTSSNISERLSIRDFMTDLRSSGMQTGGPQPFSSKDKEKFANSLDRTLTKILAK